MRSILATFLAILITLCPLLCGAAEFGQGAHRHDVSGSPSHDSSAPDQCPEEGDNCICQGAVQADHIRFLGAHATGHSIIVGLLLPTPLHLLFSLSQKGASTGLGRWGNALAVRSFLQNYRC
ncbi:hypothetical protein [Singulisphaera acidiphila]|uniref:Uncharacterized protein n=1 Tax=Singulisphaera acidiphila (strain ATCC BAA-1392 / DSM 18658 / VKM B-2454 / MOB10) TaxID=886293 RepID=L0DAN1_SINAD|nr:hypothetical protein [Singulisphaera acidiphila]AGA26429.1 hypothetical protein Sinac_2094 [Singulisphaera acidiphila DSM 18658]